MGVPVVAFYGDRRSARSTAVIAEQISHPELVADSIPTYVEAIQDLIADTRYLSDLRATLRNQALATIANPRRFTRDLEACFATIWNQWCEGR